MRGRSFLLATVAAFVIASQTVSGHHGGAAFDQSKSVTFAGTVTEMMFANPHVLVYWNVKDGEAADSGWSGWLTAPNKLARAGWTKRTLNPGDKITVTGVPHKSGQHILQIRKLVGPDGKELPLSENQ